MANEVRVTPEDVQAILERHGVSLMHMDYGFNSFYPRSGCLTGILVLDKLGSIEAAKAKYAEIFRNGVVENKYPGEHIRDLHGLPPEYARGLEAGFEKFNRRPHTDTAEFDQGYADGEAIRERLCPL